MGMLDDLLGAVVGGQEPGASAARPGPGLPAGLGGGAIAALLPVLLSMLSQGGRAPGVGGGGLGDLLGQVLGGGAGGAGGLGGLLQQLERAGLGSQAQSWVGTGPNEPIAPDAIGRLFGHDGLTAIARQAGLSQDETMAGLARLLPAVVDHVTPQGQLPGGDELESALSGLMQRLGR